MAAVPFLRCGVVAGALLLGTVARADINLVLRPVPEPCAAGVINIGLYAVSDDSSNQSLIAMDVILAWDPTALRLLGLVYLGPYPYDWMLSGFPVDEAFDGLNNSFTDGNALYSAYARLGEPAEATPEGLLVAHFGFDKLTVGLPTTMEILDSFGNYTRTVVYDGHVPGLDVTGTLEGASFTPSPKGDTNCDTHVNALDIHAFVVAVVDAAQYAIEFPGCDMARADMNCDDQVNALDINPFVRRLVGD